MSQPNKNERKRLLRLSCPLVAAKRAAYETKASLEEEAPDAAPDAEATKNATERQVGLLEEIKTWTKLGEPKAKAVVAWSLDASESVGALVDATRDKKHNADVQKALDKYLETQRTAKHLAIVTFKYALQQQWVWTEDGVSEWQTPRWVYVLLGVRAP
ncbi:unnamed protein product [Prorocentrum cordatum]|uniref:Uncharacterized protein n=1 Tax=Prorocentrum cordatum TaxID=2364126 RepID=A0ABN9XWG4_9DINO|nr:unnamed protein product [Polarella glacialis]